MDGGLPEIQFTLTALDFFFFLLGLATLGGEEGWEAGKRKGKGRKGQRTQKGGGGWKSDPDSPFWAVAEYKECFSLYDKQQRGKIKATDLLTVMRCLGASPTPGEVGRHLQTHGIGEWARLGQLPWESG